MLHLEPAGSGERVGAGARAGVEASDEGVSSVVVGATTELPGIFLAMAAIPCYSEVAFGLSSRAVDKIHSSRFDLTKHLPVDPALER